MKNRVVIIGQNPSEEWSRTIHVKGALKKLFLWADIWELQCFGFYNVFQDRGKVDVRKADLNSLKSACAGCKIIALGAVASKALSLCNIEHFKMPHPSGRNRILNDKELEKRLIAECREFIARPKAE